LYWLKISLFDRNEPLRCIHSVRGITFAFGILILFPRAGEEFKKVWATYTPPMSRLYAAKDTKKDLMASIWKSCNITEKDR
jgi:hypothetical protein